MKKILAIVLILCVLISTSLASALAVSAGTSIGRYATQEILTLSDDDIVYSAIIYTASDNARAYEFSYWVEQMGYLDDIRDYTVEYSEELEREYNEYIKSLRQAVLAEGEAFFAKHFDASTDELLRNSDRRALIMVRSSVATIKALENVDGCAVFESSTSEDSVNRRYETNDYYTIVPDYYVDISPYELVYAMHFYEDIEEPRYIDRLSWNIGEYIYYNKYDHYGDTEDATPDYVLAFSGENVCSPAYSAGGFGDKYLLQEYNIYYPYTLGYHIITTEDMKVYTLREAWDAQIEGIEDVFEDFGLGEKRGDSDGDGEITIKDATLVQKCIAKLEKFTEYEYVSGFAEKGQGEDGMFHDRISDMNRDGEVDIKDATAIQKYIAGIKDNTAS